SNIMSLGGLALAIGVLVDASIVMVENGYRHLSEQQEAARARGQQIEEAQRQQILMAAAKQVGRPLFYSLIIIVVSFLPVFLLEAQEGRMFRPLADTKTLAMTFSSILAITIVPVLMILLIRGRRLRPEEENPVSRFFKALYLPIIRWCLRHRWLTIGRSNSATDNAPLDMYDTTIMLKPREQWPKGVTYESLVADMDAKLHFPGLSNSWTMPVENRLDMELTGIKTPVGIKVQGPNL